MVIIRWWVAYAGPLALLAAGVAVVVVKAAGVVP